MKKLAEALHNYYENPTGTTRLKLLIATVDANEEGESVYLVANSNGRIRIKRYGNDGKKYLPIYTDQDDVPSGALTKKVELFPLLQKLYADGKYEGLLLQKRNERKPAVVLLKDIGTFYDLCEMMNRFKGMNQAVQ